MLTGIAIFASVFLWLIVKEKGFRRVVFIGAAVVTVLAAVIGAGVAIWYYGINLPEARKAELQEKARQEAVANQWTLLSPEETAKRYRLGSQGKTNPPIANEPDGYVKISAILYGASNLSGRAVGTAEINDIVKIVARDNVFRTLRVKDVRTGLQGWVSEDNIEFVVGKPITDDTKQP